MAGVHKPLYRELAESGLIVGGVLLYRAASRVHVDRSRRYGVVGIYRDRDEPIVRIYPLPFVRVSVRWR